MKKKTYPVFTISGFLLLSGMVTLVLVPTVSQAFEVHPTAGVIALLVLFGAFISLYYQGQTTLKGLKSTPWSQPAIAGKNFLAVFFGGIVAFILAQNVGSGAVVSASLVGIAAYLILPKFSVPAYCGAFVGMTSELLLFNHGEVALASALAGIVYLLTEPLFPGFGGKLGTIALIGTASTGVGLGRSFLPGEISAGQTGGLIILIALIASPLTFYLSNHRKHGPVLGSATVGLIAGLILPILFPQAGVTLAVVAHCASFTGMTSPERCRSFRQIFISGFFTAFVFIFSAPFFAGSGGKLGTIAFASVLSTCGYFQLYRRLKNEILRSKTDSHR